MFRLQLAEFGGGLTGLVVLRGLYPSDTTAAARSVTLPHDAVGSGDDPMIDTV
jgi:hypothetical protein